MEFLASTPGGNTPEQLPANEGIQDLKGAAGQSRMIYYLARVT
jgi:hypothetical protein